MIARFTYGPIYKDGRQPIAHCASRADARINYPHIHISQKQQNKRTYNSTTRRLVLTFIVLKWSCYFPLGRPHKLRLPTMVCAECLGLNHACARVCGCRRIFTYTHTHIYSTTAALHTSDLAARAQPSLAKNSVQGLFRGWGAAPGDEKGGGREGGGRAAATARAATEAEAMAAEELTRVYCNDEFGHTSEITRRDGVRHTHTHIYTYIYICIYTYIYIHK